MHAVNPPFFNASDKLGSLVSSRFSKPTHHKRARYSSSKKKEQSSLAAVFTYQIVL